MIRDSWVYLYTSLLAALSVVEQDKSVDRALHQFAREPGDPWNLTGKIELEQGEPEYQSQGSYANVYKVMCNDGSGRRVRFFVI